jgi:DNA topoisomerase IA
MGHKCGPKLSKAEYLLIQNGRPYPKHRCSDVAKELEKDFPDLEPEEIYARMDAKLKELEKKRKTLETRMITMN